MDDIKLPANAVKTDTYVSKTSANVLCKYMEKPKYLYEILSCMAIKPRYFEELIDYYRVDSLSSISIPMVCFCDIPLSKIKEHTSFYGGYGIALDKHSIIKKDVQPITYINTNSKYFHDLSYSISQLLLCEKQIDSEWSFLADFVMSQMLYSKPVYGKMRKNNETIERLFKDECEWRFIPDVPEDMELILIHSRNTDAGRNLYNKALANSVNKSTWLSFSPDEIRYLVVPSESESIDLIKYITSLEYDETVRYKLISKIEISSNIGSNFL